jgi:dCMP deaminase
MSAMTTDKWLRHGLDMATLSAMMSKDTTHVGAVLMRGKAVLLTSFNGPPAGVEDRPERFERPAKYLFASHAEANLIAFASRFGICTDGATVVVTHAPCDACARLMIQAGIKSVAYGGGRTSMPQGLFDAATTMLAEAGVEMKEVGK